MQSPTIISTPFKTGTSSRWKMNTADKGILHTRQRMIEAEGRSPPYGILLALVVFLLVSAPSLLGDGEAITEAFSEILSPAVPFYLPILLLLAIQFLSSGYGTALSSIFSSGGPDSIHRFSGSPVGVAFFLLLFLFLVYNRGSMFGGEDDSGD
ncbi:hypothetical protein Ancab_030594 [Ancistrocladus abbreviatus]